ncbi:insulin-like growth factor-binding protein 3 isoform X2 [Mugil cephalus]|uniref:insulin-like growth factor-binding protein 3 isoform X2 n=1 Tax=Mugil cephalus TaxID=48193 RepID=UPI001FB82E6D|nr:insulin-like growth factor-binding protein 3 isoform X2 [Mugil cephalus]
MFEMFLNIHILVLVLLKMALSSPLTTASRGCATCNGKPSQAQPSADLNATALALGERCGIYTLSCGHGLRCAPQEDDPRPLRALVEGRGVCSNATGISPTKQVHTLDSEPTEDPDMGPCSKLLSTVMKALDARVIKPHQDIYLPNCDKNGFFLRQQCWSSRGVQRRRCWCVDKNGKQVSTNTKQKRSVSC